jgi:hypothetical protein
MSPPPEMRQPLTAQWNLPISSADFEILKTGFQSQSMDDKWNAIPTFLRESNAYSVVWSRSWTGDFHYILIIKETLPGTAGPGIESMIYESYTTSDIRITAEMAKEEVICLARGWLECEIKKFPEIDYNRVFSYPLEQTTE